MALVQRRTSIHPIINRRGCDASELDVKVVSLGVKASQCQQVTYMVRSTLFAQDESHPPQLANAICSESLMACIVSPSGPFSNQTIVSREPDSEPYRHEDR